MAGRYTDWCRVRGDTTDPVLRDIGRKLLGDLKTRREQGGVKTIAQTCKLEDGREVRARFVYDQPILEIRGAPKKPAPRAIARVLEGFITRPSPNSNQFENAAKNHVLLQPTSDDLVPWWFDETFVPEDFDGTPRFYGGLFPDGIGRYGNVDWRSADQSVVLSWMGPSARYFGYGSGAIAADYYVFLHGQVLYDATAEHALDVLSELTLDAPVYVRGACMRAPSWLYVVLRDDDAIEALVRYKVKSPKMRALSALAGVNAAAHYFADAVVDYESGELLLLATDADFGDGFHPFFFNTDGSEARRIFQLGGETHEVRLIENDDGWIRNVDSTSIEETVSTVAERAHAPAGSYSYTYHVPDDVDPTLYTTHVMSGDHTQSYSPDLDEELVGNAEPIVSSSIVHTRTPEAPTHLVAVDFWDGEWRYASEYLIAETKTSLYGCAMAVDSTINTGISVYGPEDPITHVAPFIGVPSTKDCDLTATFTGNETFLATSAGIQCAFLDATSNVTTQNTVTLAITQTETLNLPYGPFDPRDGDAFGEWTAAFARTHVEVDTEVYVNYLDLRFGIAYWQTRVETTTTSLAGEAEASNTTTYDGAGDPTTVTVGDWSAPFRIEDMPEDSTSQVVWTTKLVAGGVEVQNIVQADDPVEADDTLIFAGDTYTWLTGWLSSYMGSDVTQIVSDVAWSNALGLLLSVVDSPAAWHTTYATLGEPAGSPAPLTFFESEDSAASFFSIGPDELETTSDFFENTTDGYGSWPFVKDVFLFDQQNPENRSSEDQFVRYANRDGASELLAAYPPEILRLYPIGYLSRTVVVK